MLRWLASLSEMISQLETNMQEDDEECEDSLKKYNSSKKNKIEVRNGLSDQEITSIFQVN